MHVVNVIIFESMPSILVDVVDGEVTFSEVIPTPISSLSHTFNTQAKDIELTPMVPVIVGDVDRYIIDGNTTIPNGVLVDLKTGIVTGMATETGIFNMVGIDRLGLTLAVSTINII